MCRMNAHPDPKSTATPRSQLGQAVLQFESGENNRRVPDQKRSECVGLLRQLIEAVVEQTRNQVGGRHD